MSANADLEAWGEPLATPDEETLANLIDDFMTRLEQGEVVEAQSFGQGPAGLQPGGQRLIQTVSLLCQCAASVWENSGMDDIAPASGRYATDNEAADSPPLPGRSQDDARSVPPGAGGPAPDPFPGEFRLVRLLGEGAYGKVWLADDLKLVRQVALKTLKLPASGTPGPKVLMALRREAQHLAQLEHPNIVRVHAWRETGGEYFLVLQFVAGGSLADRLQSGKALIWQDAARYVADVGEALIEAHKRGVIHRDIKPANILWDAARDEALITDFGVSAHLAEPGTKAGTPSYMAPEAFAGQVSPALDVYGLAATLFHLATGELPFAMAPTRILTQQKLQGLSDSDQRCRAIPEALEQIIRAGLAGKPEQRPGMADFVAALRGSLNQLLADALVPSALETRPPAAADLRLVVRRLGRSESFEPLAATRPKSRGLSRDMIKVPRPPDQVALRTGDRLRIEVVSDKSGYVTVFNVGPTGNLNLLFPDELPIAASAPNIQGNQPLHILDVELMPPAGRERLFAVWSRAPLPLPLEQFQSLAERGKFAGSRPYCATRDMVRVKESIHQMQPKDWSAAVLELQHTA